MSSMNTYDEYMVHIKNLYKSYTFANNEKTNKYTLNEVWSYILNILITLYQNIHFIKWIY